MTGWIVILNSDFFACDLIILHKLACCLQFLMTNFLLHTLNKYYKEMMSLEGKIFVLNGFVKTSETTYKKGKPLTEN